MDMLHLELCQKKYRIEAEELLNSGIATEKKNQSK